MVASGWESCGVTNKGTGALRRDDPDLAACEAERLTTRGMSRA
jgi:hypothetical protein